MTKISLGIDEKVLVLVQEYARETGTTVEGLIVEHSKPLRGRTTPSAPSLRRKHAKNWFD
jgi:hypothetical protein